MDGRARGMGKRCFRWRQNGIKGWTSPRFQGAFLQRVQKYPWKNIRKMAPFNYHFPMLLVMEWVKCKMVWFLYWTYNKSLAFNLNIRWEKKLLFTIPPAVKEGGSWYPEDLWCANHTQVSQSQYKELSMQV